MDRGLRRRDFFKVLAAGGASAAAAAGCSDAPEKLIPLLVPPDNIEYAPGNPVEYATTCAECAAGCGIVMSTREGRAIKAEGNPDHPLNQGALCIRGQASLQTSLYNPSRLRQAMLRSETDWAPAEWQAAEAAAAQALGAVADKSRIAYLTDRAGGTRGKLIDQWLQALGAGPKIVLDPLAFNAQRAAAERAFGRAEVPLYRISRATLLVNFGSDFLETWGNPVRQGREFAEMHSANDQSKSRGRAVHVGPHVSLSGANTDAWLPCAPGSEAVIALAMARAVLERKGRNLPPDEQQRLQGYLQSYTLDRAAADSGADKAKLESLAAEFVRAERPLALGGGTSLAHQAGTDALVAIHILNYVAGAVGETVQFGAAQESAASPVSDVLALVEKMKAGGVDVLIVDGANPAYLMPAASGVEEALGKVKTIISLSSAWDETSRLAHIALPSLSAYERWGDSFPLRGVFALSQPVMAPVFAVKGGEDTLIALGKAAGLRGFDQIADFRAYLMAEWRALQRDTGSTEPFEQFWRHSLQQGGVFRQVSASSLVRLNPAVFNRPLAAPKLEGEGLALIPTPSLRHGAGDGAVSPWLQEIPDPMSQITWDSWVDIHPDTAKKLGIAHNDPVVVTSAYGTVTSVAYLHYGVHRDAIAIPLGQGHTGTGRTADLRGVNVVSLLGAKTDPDSGDLAYLSTRVTVARGEGKVVVAHMDGSPRQGHRDIIQTISPEEFEKGKKPASGHGGGESHAARPVNFYKPRDETPGYYEPYRWGMVIDTDRCTGCSACVAACYAENNVPVVGKERVKLGREMSWLRIERFLEGEGDDFKTLVQPMLCQHCENAGCEPVCPVYATYHTPEGLNAQVYNRCVGTRYCSNNCAYKVRRFNWFNYEWDEPLHLQLNPDVTVRSKGVMEKCTFCVQRITRARMAANAEGRDLRDGEVTTACMQTCASKAITFGNLTDPQSAVSQKAKRGEGGEAARVREYEVLADLANKPSITYLRKVMSAHTKEA